MSGLLGLSGSLPLFLSLCCFSLSPLAINPLFSCYCISHCIFPPIFPSVQMFPFDLFMSDTMSECPVHFLWDHSAFISFHLDARFLPLCSSTQLLQFIFLPPALKFCALMLFFPPLVRSLFLLYLSPSSAFPLSFIFCLPLCPSFLYDPIWFREITSLTLHLLCKAASPCISLCPFSSSLIFLFLPYFFLLHFLCLLPLPVLRLIWVFYCFMGMCSAPLVVTVLSQVSPQLDPKCPRHKTEVLREGNQRMLLLDTSWGPVSANRQTKAPWGPLTSLL